MRHTSAVSWVWSIYDSTPCTIIYSQAWAFSAAVRRLLGKSPPMNMLSFPKDVWVLHRKLHHRFLKFKKRFIAATEDLRDYKRREGSLFAGSDTGQWST